MMTRRQRDHRKTIERPLPKLDRSAAAPLPDPPATSLAPVLGFCLALWIAAAFVPANWAWGMDAFRYLPVEAAVALAGLALAGFVPAVARPVNVALDRTGTAWIRHPVLTEVLVGVAVSLMLLVLRDPVRFIGDSDVRLGLITSGIPSGRLFPQAFPLDLLVNAHLPRALVALGLTAEQTLQIVGALMGGLYVAIGLAFLRAAGARGAALPACAIALLGGGYMLAVPGYDKFGPLLVGIALAALGAVRLSRASQGGWTLAAGSAVCVLSHRSGYLIVLPAMMAFGLAMNRARNRSHLARLAAPALSASLIAAALLPRTIDVFLHYDLTLQRAAAAAAAGSEWMAALSRVSDVINVLFFLVPLWPIGVAAFLAQRRTRAAVRGPGFSLAPVATLAVGLQLIMTLALRGAQGAARDWDVHSGVGATLGLCMCHLLARRSQQVEARRFWPALSTTALAITIALWSITMIEAIQLERIRTLLAGRPAWNAEHRARAFDFLGFRAFNRSHFDESAEHFEKAVAAAPNPRYFYQAGLARWRGGDLKSAQRLELEAVRRAPDKADPWWVLAAIARAAGDSAAAAAREDSAHARGSRHPPLGL